jgi:hypothetical protein
MPALFTMMSSGRPAPALSNSAHSRSASPGSPSSACTRKPIPPSRSIRASVSLAACSLLP